MENLIYFLKIIAWTAGIISTFLGILTLYNGINYPGSTEELMDRVNGFQAKYKPLPFFVVALVCWAFIIAF